LGSEAIGRRGLGLAGLALLAPSPARAVAGPVTLLVGGPPGGTADDWARSFAPFLERHMPRAAVGVVNRPGEGGLAAARALAAAAPDGHVIGAFATPLLLARAVSAGALPLLERLVFVGAVAEEPVVLVGHPGTAEDLAALRALGDRAVLAAPQAGSAAQLAGLNFARLAPMTVLAFPNAAAARQAVVAGNVACAMLAAPDAIAALRDGRLVGLGVAASQRSALLPEVPTLAEQGVALRQVGHRGFALPAGTDAATLAGLAAALKAVVADPEFVDAARDQGYVARFLGQAEWEPMLRGTATRLAERWISDPWVPRRD